MSMTARVALALAVVVAVAVVGLCALRAYDNHLKAQRVGVVRERLDFIKDLTAPTPWGEWEAYYPAPREVAKTVWIFAWRCAVLRQAIKEEERRGADVNVSPPPTVDGEELWWKCKGEDVEEDALAYPSPLVVSCRGVRSPVEVRGNIMAAASASLSVGERNALRRELESLWALYELEEAVEVVEVTEIPAALTPEFVTWCRTDFAPGWRSHAETLWAAAEALRGPDSARQRVEMKRNLVAAKRFERLFAEKK